ncbi:MAG: AEC family transporter [Solirubrobacteraceae bacterium]|nr:AEC family transporter [Solirubrobacteraceae bacterium]
MILIAAAVVVAMIAGVQARRTTDRTDAFVTASLDLVLFVLLPVIAFAFASRLELTLATFVGLLGGYAMIAIIGVLAWQVASRRLGLTRKQQGAVVLSVILANTGYLGLPVAITLLGRDEFPQAVAWDSFISQPMALLVAPFIAGAFAGVHEDRHVGQKLVTVLRRAPALPALAIGLIVPGHWVGDWLFDLATYAVYGILPLGFFAVGATLQRLRSDDAVRPPRQAVALIVGLRIVVAPALFAVLVLVLPDEPRAFMLQAAMPCGINALVIGHGFDLDRGLTSLAIAWSTGIVIAAALVGTYVV